MDRCLNPKVVLLNSSTKDKERTKKPWWSDTLSNLWNEMCVEAKKWLRSSGSERKKSNRISFIQKRKSFDREIKRAKRRHWFSLQEDLSEHCDKDSEEFWRKISRLGVGNERISKIPMEVTLQNGTISNRVEDVLHKWRDCFHELLSLSSNNDTQYEKIIPDDEDSNQNLNERISLLEVKRAIRRLKKGKSFGYDGIPSEVLTSEQCVEFLHKLFNKCFESGKVPSVWTNCIIKVKR